MLCDDLDLDVFVSVRKGFYAIAQPCEDEERRSRMTVMAKKKLLFKNI